MSKRPGDDGYAPGWCIHYRYQPRLRSEDQTCEAGVNYRELVGQEHTFGRLPCYLNDDGSFRNADHVECPKFRAPTQEEIALNRQWLDRRMEMMRVAMTTIRPWRAAHKGRSATESIECPLCRGRLHLSIAAYNGHVHGRCETPDCVSWME